MEIINNFGVNPVLLVAQIINFLIIMYILKRFAYKPILSMLEKRKITIEKGLKDAEEARILLEKASQKERDLLKKAQQETRKLLDEAKKEREEIIKKSDEAAKQRAESILTDAREQIAFETREVEKRLTAHVSQLSIQFLQKSLSDLFTDEDQHRIIDKALKKVKEKIN